MIPIDHLEALDVPHYLYTFIIVDMRPGNQAILVQQKSSAFENPDEVAAHVTDYCSRVLQLSSLVAVLYSTPISLTMCLASNVPGMS